MDCEALGCVGKRDPMPVNGDSNLPTLPNQPAKEEGGQLIWP